uniref:Uncharacterized protein n=1 Tax=Kalanchoe fedtschenkoi TaxID=63787 RepID=A0A7N0RJM1_KALFE
MVFLESVCWDETLAGPAPQTGLVDRVRKYHSSPSTSQIPSAGGVSGPAPFSVGKMKRMMLQKMGRSAEASNMSPAACDWLVISALDG